MSVWNYNGKGNGRLATPISIVNGYCQELSDLSDGRIIARATEYRGKYKSVFHTIPYKKVGDLSSVSISHAPLGEPSFNVQSVLGDTGADDSFVYELFLTSENTPKYRYRMLFFYYGIAMYPVGLTVQEDIAKEIGMVSDNTSCENERTFRELLAKAMGCAVVGRVIDNLLAMNAAKN